jgi:hypothetical protein
MTRPRLAPGVSDGVLPRTCVCLPKATLVEPIEVLTNWARDYGGAIADFQETGKAADLVVARQLPR